MAWTPLALATAALWGAWVVIADRARLYYSWRTERIKQELERVAGVWLLALGLTALAGALFGFNVHFHAGVTLLTGLVLLLGSRYAVRRLARQLRVAGHNFRRAILVGRSAVCERFAAQVQATPHFGIRIVGSLAFRGESRAAPEGVPDLGEVTRLQEVVRSSDIDYVLVSPGPSTQSEAVDRILRMCEEAGVPCHFAPGFVPMHSVPAVAWYGSIPTVAFAAMPHSPIRLTIKRAIDIVGAAAGLILTAPITVACAILIKLQDGGPIFFTQRRVGLGGRPFQMLKFRTMTVGAESQQAALATKNERAGPIFKMRHDPRVTGIGRLLRKYSLDELPQLLNVLRGDMSLVGPRPHPVLEVRKYTWWHRRRHSLRPGLTGVWQVQGRVDFESFDRWVALELDYIDHWSLWRDFKLIVQTIPALARGSGT